MRRTRWVVVALSLVARSALAQDVSTKAAAEGLFDQGRELMRKGDFANACGFLERSQQIDPAVGTLLYLAECYEKSGRPASAWATFREAASSARAVGQVDRAKLGEERAERLTPILPRLAVDVGEATRAIPGLSVRREGQAVPPAAWNVAVPLDPGQYRIEASAPGYQDFTTTVEVPEGARTTRVSVALLHRTTGAPTPAETPPPGPGVTPALEPQVSTQPVAPVPAEPASGGGAQRTLAFVVGGVGAAGIVVGSIFGLRAISKNGDAEDLCPDGPNQCRSNDAVTLTDDADKAATISNIAFGLGAAALAGGLVLYLTAPSSSDESPSLAAAVSPSGVWLKGAF